MTVLQLLSLLLLMAAVAVGDNLVVVSRQAWRARAPTRVENTLTTPLEYVVLHHTATPPCSTPDKCASRVRSIQDDHLKGGWSDIAYNFLVGGDGQAYAGRGWDTQGSHTKGWNVKSVGIALIGDFKSAAPSDAQLQTVQQLIALGVSLGKVSADHNAVGACQIIRTQSPGQLTVDKIKAWSNWWSYSFKGAYCK